jgi:hypothetical protein
MVTPAMMMMMTMTTEIDEGWEGVLEINAFLPFSCMCEKWWKGSKHKTVNFTICLGFCIKGGEENWPLIKLPCLLLEVVCSISVTEQTQTNGKINSFTLNF